MIAVIVSCSCLTIIEVQSCITPLSVVKSCVPAGSRGDQRDYVLQLHNETYPTLDGELDNLFVTYQLSVSN